MTYGTYAVFVRGELLGVYAAEDVGTRDVFIAVVRDQAEREELARAFRVSPATVGRVVTRFNEGGLRAVADHGRHGGRRVRTPALEKPAGGELFDKGLGGARGAPGGGEEGELRHGVRGSPGLAAAAPGEGDAFGGP
ncbi:MAG: helix-turn-helix domain-containing protein [Anaeromyxobacter sp.]